MSIPELPWISTIETYFFEVVISRTQQFPGGLCEAVLCFLFYPVPSLVLERV